MNQTVTICIPTYRRVALLEHAIRSAAAQTYSPVQILVGDDSPDDATMQLVERLKSELSVPITYLHNVPPLGQGKNVNALFQAVKSEYLVLLHDDDVLLPNAVTRMIETFKAHPNLTAVWGDQYVIDMEGTRLMEASKRLNDTYYRTPDRAGLQIRGVPGLLRMFPNDGYMVRTSAAQSTGYRSREEASRHVDSDFGIRLTCDHQGFYYINEYLCEYRLTDEAESKGLDTRAEILFKNIKKMDVPDAARSAQETALSKLAPAAIRSLALIGRRREALTIFFGPYMNGKRITPMGCWLLTITFMPFLHRLRHRWRGVP